MDIECSGPQQTGVVGKNFVEIEKDCNTYYVSMAAKGQYILQVYELNGARRLSFRIPFVQVTFSMD
jgi:hypothetical protein